MTKHEFLATLVMMEWSHQTDTHRTPTRIYKDRVEMFVYQQSVEVVVPGIPRKRFGTDELDKIMDHIDEHNKHFDHEEHEWLSTAIGAGF